jgi:hypothetical protein
MNTDHLAGDVWERPRWTGMAASRRVDRDQGTENAQ